MLGNAKCKEYVEFFINFESNFDHRLLLKYRAMSQFTWTIENENTSEQDFCSNVYLFSKLIHHHKLDQTPLEAYIYAFKNN